MDPTSTQGSKSGSVTYDWTETVTENGSATTTGDNWADNEEVGNGSYSSNSSGGVFHWQAYFQHYQDQRPGQILAQPPKPNASAPATADSGPQQTWSQWAGQGISDAGNWIYDNASFLGHTALDLLGLIPVVGNAADLTNAAWYSWEGDYTNAALSTASAAIGVGIGVTLVKYGKIILDAAPLNAVKNVTDTIGTFVGDTLTGAQKLLADQSGAIDVTALYDGMEWVGAKFTGWGPFGRGIAPKRLPTKPQHPDVPKYPKSPHSKPVTSSTTPGEYVFVQDADGVVYVVPQASHAHPTVLGGGQPAAAAGEITIGPNGVVTEINNISGTFQHDASVLPGVQKALEQAGLKVAPDAIKPFQW